MNRLGRKQGNAQLAAVAAGLALAAGQGIAQTKPATVPDAQVESNVLKALSSDPRLASQTIRSTTVYGTVTLSGSVPDEATRTDAETVISRTAGVLKVVDELTLGSPSATASAQMPEASDPSLGTNPNLQSDGTVAAPGTTPRAAASSSDVWGPAGPPPDVADPNQSGQMQPGGNQPAPPYGGQPGNQAGVGPYNGQPTPPYGGQPGDQASGPYNGQPGSQSGSQSNGGAYGNQGGYGAPPPYPNSRAPQAQGPYGPQPAYGQYPGPGAPQAYGNGQPAYPNPGQPGGQLVSVPGGSDLRIRINQGIDSKNAQPGMTFDGIVVQDVVASGAIAIPRGAAIHGVVVDSESAGVLKGRGELQLKLTAVTLGGSTYPIESTVWARHGGDKTIQTVDSAVGLGALGAVLGAVTGGGAGAAIGAGVGGAVGVGSSAASGRGQVGIPPESVLDFHLTQPVQVATLSQAELDRLGYGVPAGAPRGFARRYPGPYGPAYYGPGPYAYGPGYVYGPGYYPRYYRYYGR